MMGNEASRKLEAPLPEMHFQRWRWVATEATEVLASGKCYFMRANSVLILQANDNLLDELDWQLLSYEEFT